LKELEPTTLDVQLRDVLLLCERLGIEVRQVHLGGSAGGFCVVRGKRVIFVDLDADSATQVDRCVAALAELPELSGVYVPPIIREAIDRDRPERPA
jgi:hypothetical protein